MKAGKLTKFYPWLLLGGSFVGLVASVWQAAERVQMLKHPAAALSCNLNPVIDCSGVLGNRWAALFGFPNAFIGIAIFGMLLMAGVALVTGTRPSKGFQRMLLAVSTILVLFSFWFFGMSLYVIGKVCIFCLFIWAVSIPVFWYGLISHFRALPPKKTWLRKLQDVFERHHLDILLGVYTVMIVLYLLRFHTYYFG